MKKVIFVFCFGILSFAFLFANFSKILTCTAYSPIDIKNILATEYANLLVENNKLARVDRTAGTEGEKSTAQYLAGRLTSFGYEPVGSGFESFEFVSSIDGLKKVSQNVVFVKKGTSSEKKVVICASYDNRYGFVEEKDAFAEIGEDTGASGILTVLAVTFQLESVELPFDVEIVFFGAGEHDSAGSYFHALSFSDEEKQNILLTINVENLSDGQLFYYDEESKTSHGEYVKAQFKANDIAIKKYSAGVSLVFSESRVLPFSHSALEGDNVNFLSCGIRTVSFLSADKNGYLSNEFFQNNLVAPFTASANPTSLEICANVSSVVSKMIQNQNFERKMLASKTNDYSFWTNDLLPIFLTAGVLVVGWAIYSVWFGALFNKLKISFNQKSSIEKVMRNLEKRIEDSENVQLKKNKEEIKKYFEDDLSRKYDNNKDEDDKENKN